MKRLFLLVVAGFALWALAARADVPPSTDKIAEGRNTFELGW